MEIFAQYVEQILWIVLFTIVILILTNVYKPRLGETVDGLIVKFKSMKVLFIVFASFKILGSFYTIFTMEEKNRNWSAEEKTTMIRECSDTLPKVFFNKISPLVAEEYCTCAVLTLTQGVTRKQFNEDLKEGRNANYAGVEFDPCSDDIRLKTLWNTKDKKSIN